MAEYQVLYWYGKVPVQVRARDVESQVDLRLPEFFEAMIEKIGQETGLICDEDCLHGYAWGDWQERRGSPEQVTQQVFGELSRRHEGIDWRSLVDGFLPRKIS